MRARPVPLLLLVALSLAAPVGAHPQPAARDGDGMLFGVRAGWAVPYGDVARDGAALSDVVYGKLPLWLEVGYRFNLHVRGSLYLEFAPASLEPACPPNATCEGFDVRFGVAMQLHPAPRSWLDPWIGVGLGVEHLQVKGPPPGDAPGIWELSWLGLEVPVEAGLDLPVSDLFTLGPYVGVSFSQFTSASVRPPGGARTSGSIDARETHGWLQAGLKLTLKL